MGCLESCVVKRVLLHDVASLNGFFLWLGNFMREIVFIFLGEFLV